MQIFITSWARADPAIMCPVLKGHIVQEIAAILVGMDTHAISVSIIAKFLSIEQIVKQRIPVNAYHVRTSPLTVRMCALVISILTIVDGSVSMASLSQVKKSVLRVVIRSVRSTNIVQENATAIKETPTSATSVKPLAKLVSTVVIAGKHNQGIARIAKINQSTLTIQGRVWSMHTIRVLGSVQSSIIRQTASALRVLTRHVKRINIGQEFVAMKMEITTSVTNARGIAMSANTVKDVGEYLWAHVKHVTTSHDTHRTLDKVSLVMLARVLGSVTLITLDQMMSASSAAITFVVQTDFDEGRVMINLGTLTGA